MKRKFSPTVKLRKYWVFGLAIVVSLLALSKSNDLEDRMFAALNWDAALGIVIYRHAPTWGGVQQSGQTTWIGIPDPDWGATIGNPVMFSFFGFSGGTGVRLGS